MLQKIVAKPFSREVFRLSVLLQDKRVLEAAKISEDLMNKFIDRVDPIEAFIKNFKQLKNLEKAYLDSVFSRQKSIKQKLRNRSRYGRFSDGTFHVLYSSLEKETAIEEVCYWHRKLFRTGEESRRRIYRILFSCEFSGSVKDLHLLTCPNACSDCPNISSDTPPLTCQKLIQNDDEPPGGYQFCRNLGTSAKTEGLDGLLTPSARNLHGKNLPVFSREALSHLCNVEYCYTVYDLKADSIRFVPIDIQSLD